MAKIIDTNTKKEVSLEDGSPIKDSCKKLGVLFSCESGNCGTCAIDIIEGQDNLSELTQEEKDFVCDRDNRLACQCKIKTGDVKIKF